MNTKHTPGPWELENISNSNDKIIVSENGQVGRIFISSPAFSDTEMELNARLIAAGPEMLEMLKKLHEEYAHFGAGYWCGTGQAVERLIAKAEGGTK